MRLLDLIVIGVILAGSAGWLLASRSDPRGTLSESNQVVVYQDGQERRRLPIGTDTQNVLSGGDMQLEIKGGRVRVSQSSCPRQHCVHQGWVKHAGESIVCVPFKTVIEIQSSARPVVDAVVY